MKAISETMQKKKKTPKNNRGVTVIVLMILDVNEKFGIANV